MSLDGVGPAFMPTVALGLGLALRGSSCRYRGWSGHAPERRIGGRQLPGRPASFAVCSAPATASGPTGGCGPSSGAVGRRASYLGRGSRRLSQCKDRDVAQVVVPARRGSSGVGCRCAIASTCRWQPTRKWPNPIRPFALRMSVVATSARPNLLLTLTVGAWL
jgi:hypothetical protein